MNLKSYTLTVIANLSIISSQINTNPVAALSVLTKPIVTNFTKSLISQAKNTATQVTQPLRTEWFLMKESLRGTRFDTRIMQPVQNVFEECIQNQTTRSLVTLKACEWILLTPGFALAASGDIQTLCSITMLCMQQGIHGYAASTLLLAGAASFYPWDVGLKQLKKIEKVMQADVCDAHESILSAMHNSI
jgi:hypothetical protein